MNFFLSFCELAKRLTIVFICFLQESEFYFHEKIIKIKQKKQINGQKLFLRTSKIFNQFLYIMNKFSSSACCQLEFSQTDTKNHIALKSAHHYLFLFSNLADEIFVIQMEKYGLPICKFLSPFFSVHSGIIFQWT